MWLEGPHDVVEDTCDEDHRQDPHIAAHCAEGYLAHGTAHCTQGFVASVRVCHDGSLCQHFDAELLEVFHGSGVKSNVQYKAGKDLFTLLKACDDESTTNSEN